MVVYRFSGLDPQIYGLARAFSDRLELKSENTNGSTRTIVCRYVVVDYPVT